MTLDRFIGRRHRLGLAATAIIGLFSALAAAEPAIPKYPTVSWPCGATYSRTPVYIVPWNVDPYNPPTVTFVFYLYPGGVCPAYGVRVLWLYRTIDKTTQQIKEHYGGQFYQFINADSYAYLQFDCVPKAGEVCIDGRGTVLPGNFIGGAKDGATAVLNVW
jgi:hypothetical protein